LIQRYRGYSSSTARRPCPRRSVGLPAPHRWERPAQIHRELAERYRYELAGQEVGLARMCVRGPASRPNSLRSDQGTTMWWWTESGEQSSTDRCRFPRTAQNRVRS
jgi:hypothetical protein